LGASNKSATFGGWGRGGAAEGICRLAVIGQGTLAGSPGIDYIELMLRALSYQRFKGGVPEPLGRAAARKAPMNWTKSKRWREG